MALKLNLPSYYQSEWYTKPQKRLYDYSSGLLEGNIPDYYKGIGETGGAELQGMMDLLGRDISKNVTEDMARRNVGSGGAGLSAIAKATADAGTQLRWQDFLRSMQGKQYLLGAGLETMSGVRGAGLQEQGMQNQFNLNKAGMEFNVNKYNDEQARADEASKGALWGDILGAGIGAAGTIAGAYFGGPGGAAVGGKLGAAAGQTVAGKKKPRGSFGDVSLRGMSPWDLQQLYNA